MGIIILILIILIILFLFLDQQCGKETKIEEKKFSAAVTVTSNILALRHFIL